MRQLFDKVRDAFGGTPEEEPQVSHRATVLNEAIRKGRDARPVPDEPVAKEQVEDPAVAFIREQQELAANDDPYNSSDYDRGKSWRHGADR